MEPSGKDTLTHGQRGVIFLHSYHLNTLHEWQPHSLVTNQRHDAGWGGGRGLQQRQHCLHAHAAGLQDEGRCLKMNRSRGDLFNVLFRLSWWSLRRNKNIYQDPVKGRRSPASLHVAQDGDPGVKAQTADDQLDTESEWRGKTMKMLC